jgi:tRNA 2-selenouridine synthase
MRSAAMAELFSNAGYEVELLTGGYKAYRRNIREDLGRPARIVVLGGLTGSGKTGLLHAIASTGEQVVDLEGLACHKGSVFGALGQPAQPTNEQFENNLHERWSQLDLSRLVWLEDESRMIGKVTLPDPVVAHITNGCLLIVEPGHETRIKRLVDEYAGFDKSLLAEAINRIADRLGGANAREAVIALENDRFEKVAAIVLAYYDKAYLFSIGRRKSKNVQNIPIQGSDPESDARRIIELANKCASDGNDLSRL